MEERTDKDVIEQFECINSLMIWANNYQDTLTTHAKQCIMEVLAELLEGREDD